MYKSNYFSIMRQRILILDDDTDLLELMSMLLCDSGYETLALSSGEKIFEAIQLFHPDLVLMDVMLAGMDGRVICSKIKRQASLLGLPVILISGTHNLADSLLHRDAPNDYITKPFEMAFLLNKIKTQLNCN
jgi:DNA-binding response OmpR family regulator